MLKKIDNSKKVGNSHISILYPGLALSEDDILQTCYSCSICNSDDILLNEEEF